MAKQDLIQLARGVVEAFNAGDWERCKSAMASNAVYDEVGTSRRIQGASAVVACWQDWKKGMPDVKGTVANSFTAGNTVVLEVTWKGKHTGPLKSPGGDLPATGKQQSTRAAWIMTFEGGKIAESRHYFDMLSFLQQLGLAPQAAATAGAV